MSNAGKWRIEVSAPHPSWCRILYEDQKIHGIHHGDLRDLHYAVERAIKEARDQLPASHKHEMD